MSRSHQSYYTHHTFLPRFTKLFTTIYHHLPRFTKLFTKHFTKFYQIFYPENLSTRKIFLGVHQALGFFRYGFCYSSMIFTRGFVSTLFFDTPAGNPIDYRRRFTSLNALFRQTEHSMGFFKSLRVCRMRSCCISFSTDPWNSRILVRIR